MAITQIRASKQINWDTTVDINGQRLTNLATPTSATDAATKEYVDATTSGLDLKASVRLTQSAALTNYTYDNKTNGTGATLTNTSGSFPTLSFDGVTPVVGNRILINLQNPSLQNGIYVVTAVGGSGANWILTRATDFDTSTEATGGAFTFVEEGTTYHDTGWVCSTDGTITIGTTGISFVQFSAAGQVVAGAGLTKSGNTIDVVGTTNRITVNADNIDIASTYVGQTSITTLGTITTGTWNGTTIAIANGGTGATTAAGARTNLGLVINTDVQAYNANLTTLAGLSPADSNFIVGSGSTWVVESGETVRTSLGLGNVENTALSTWAGSTNITTLGTITTGTWHGSMITSAYGGTGIAPAGISAYSFLMSNGVTWIPGNFSEGSGILISGTANEGELVIENSGVLSINGSVGDITGVAVTSSTLAQFAATTSAQLAGVISDETGSGKLVFATSPTLITPILGVATATSINGLTLTANAAGFSIAGGTTSKTLTVSNTLTFTGTDASSVAFGGGGTVAYTANKLSAFASTTSAELAGVISDETGSGSLVFATGSTLSGTTLSGTTTMSALTASTMLVLNSSKQIVSATYKGVPVTGAVPASWSGDSATFTQAGATTKSNIQVWANGMLMLEGTDYTLTNNSGTSFIVNFADSFSITSSDNIIAAFCWV